MVVYKDQDSEIGVISFQFCTAGKAYLPTTPDTTAKFNRIRFQPSAGQCPNKRLQELWTQHGEDDFELRVVQRLEYEDLTEDHTDELETFCELCLVENPQAKQL